VYGDCYASLKGVPVRTIAHWLQHSDLETSLRYLAAIEYTEREASHSQIRHLRECTSAPSPSVEPLPAGRSNHRCVRPLRIAVI
jgi:hypothetical protein